MMTRTKWAAVVVLGLAPMALLAADEPAEVRFSDAKVDGLVIRREAETPIEVPVGATVFIANPELNDSQKEHALAEQTAAMVAVYGKADDQEKRAKIRDELSKKVAEHFDLRHARRAKELKELEEQVARLRTLQDQRLAQKDRIIKDRVEALLVEADGLGWGKEVDSKKYPSTYYGPTTTYQSFEVPALKNFKAKAQESR